MGKKSTELYVGAGVATAGATEMERWKGRVALVTGASVGIGAAIARALVQQGMRVVGCARNVDKIEVSCFIQLSLTAVT